MILVGSIFLWPRSVWIFDHKQATSSFTFQIITIDFAKKAFAIYGAIEKIEIFRRIKTNAPIVHVTFQESRACYLALIDYAQNLTRHNVESIRPAFSHQQPDNSMDSTRSTLYNLPDECLLKIIKKLNLFNAATLSVVCKKMQRLIKENVFVNERRLTFQTTNDAEVVVMLVFARRIINCVKPKAFHLKMYRNLATSEATSHLWPEIEIDLYYDEKSRLSVEMEFFRNSFLGALELIATRIATIHIQCTIYDTLLHFKRDEELLWAKATKLILSGFSMSKRIPNFAAVVNSLPRLEELYFQNWFFNDKIKNFCTGQHLRYISFEKCSFLPERMENQISNIPPIVKQRTSNIFPLCIKFDSIKYSTKVSVFRNATDV